MSIEELEIGDVIRVTKVYKYYDKLIGTLNSNSIVLDKKDDISIGGLDDVVGVLIYNPDILGHCGGVRYKNELCGGKCGSSNSGNCYWVNDKYISFELVEKGDIDDDSTLENFLDIFD